MTFSKEDTKVVKGAAVMLMLYHHLFAWPLRIAEDISYISCFEIAGNTSAYWVGLFGKLCVALFFFLGGYGTFLSARKSENLTRTIWGKIKNLYTAYWKVFVFFVPICMLCGVPRVEKDLFALVGNFFGFDITYNGEWWFFTPYVLLIAAYPAVHKLINRNSNVFTDLFGVFLWNTVIKYVVPNILSYPWAASLNNSHFWKLFYGMLPHTPIFLLGCVFAKYDLLAKVKERFSGKLSGFLLGAVVLLLTFYLRKRTSLDYDIVYAPVFASALILFLSIKPGKPIYFLLKKVGQESTTIWLVHSFYCYHLCQRFIFLPRYTPLIFLLLLAVSYATAVLLRCFFSLLKKVCKKWY